MSSFIDFNNKGSAPFEFTQNLNVKNRDKFDKLMEPILNHQCHHYTFHKQMLIIYKIK